MEISKSLFHEFAYALGRRLDWTPTLALELVDSMHDQQNARNVTQATPSSEQ